MDEKQPSPILSLDDSFAADKPKENIEVSVPKPEDKGLSGYEARVQGYLPKAEETVLKGPTIDRYTPPSTALPILGPAWRKVISGAEAALGKGEGEDYWNRYASNEAWKDALERSRQKHFAMEQIPGQVGVGLGAALITPELEIGNMGAQAFGKLAQTVEPYLPKAVSYLEKAPGALADMAKNAIWGGSSSLAEAKPGETVGETAERTAMGSALGASVTPVLSAAGKILASPLKTAESFFDPKTAALRELYEGAGRAGQSTKYKGRLTPDEYQTLVDANVPAKLTDVNGRVLSHSEYMDAKNSGAPVQATDLAGRPISHDDYVSLRNATMPNVGIYDIAGGPEKLSAAAARFQGDPRITELNNNIKGRINGSYGLVGNAVDSAFNQNVDAFALRQQADAMARRTNAPLYDAAYRHPNAQSIWNGTIEQTINSNEGKAAVAWAENEARKDAINTGRMAPVNPFVADNNGNLILNQGQTGASLEFLDYVKRGLNKVYGDQAATRDPARFTTQNMNNKFTENLKNAVPGYDTALSNSGKFIRGNNAFDAGTQFVELLPTAGAVTPGALRAQLERFNSASRNALTPSERDQFRVGFGAWIKENPGEAAAIFKGNSPESLQARNAARFVLGNNAFHQIDQSLTVSRTAAMLQEIKANPGLLQKIGLTPAEAGVAAGGLGTLAGYGATKLGEIPNLAQYAQQHPYMTGLSAIAGIGALGSRAGSSKRLDALLDMASSTDPKVARDAADQLAKIAAGNTNWEKALNKIENTLGIYLAQHRMGQPNLPVVGPTNFEERKVGRATGGRVSAERLVQLAERAKKEVNKTTEPLLNHDDSAVARALEVANRNIEG